MPYRWGQAVWLGRFGSYRRHAKTIMISLSCSRHLGFVWSSSEIFTGFNINRPHYQTRLEITHMEVQVN